MQCEAKDQKGWLKESEYFFNTILIWLTRFVFVFYSVDPWPSLSPWVELSQKTRGEMKTFSCSCQIQLFDRLTGFILDIQTFCSKTLVSSIFLKKTTCFLGSKSVVFGYKPHDILIWITQMKKVKHSAVLSASPSLKNNMVIKKGSLP